MNKLINKLKKYYSILSAEYKTVCVSSYLILRLALEIALWHTDQEARQEPGSFVSNSCSDACDSGQFGNLLVPHLFPHL